eukprot:3729914-Rhodomonas_salina.4
MTCACACARVWFGRGLMGQLQRKRAELMGQLQMATEESGSVENQIELLEMRLRNAGGQSDHFRIQKEALDHAIEEAEREGALLKKQLEQAEKQRDAQVSLDLSAWFRAQRRFARAAADGGRRGVP